MQQPARFAARSKILRDQSISEGCRLLYLYIDDALKGARRGALVRKISAVEFGISEREWTYRIRSLEEAGYLATKRTIRGNMYDLMLHGRAGADVHGRAARMCTGVQVDPISKNLQEPLTPYGETIKPKSPLECGACSGIGITSRVIRGMAQNTPCKACGGWPSEAVS